MEWLDTAKTWLTDNAVWLSPLAILLGLMAEYIWKPIRSLWGKLFGNKEVIPNSPASVSVEANPQNTITNAPVVNVNPEITVQGNSGDTAALADRIIILARENESLKRDSEGWRQEKEALERTVADLKGRQGPDAVEALKHLESGETERAKNLYQQIGESKADEGATANREAAEAYVNLGSIAFSNDTEEALAAYIKATELDPDNAETWNKLGHLQKRKGLLDAAEISYKQVLSLSSKADDKTWKAAALVSLGNIAKTRGDLDTAEDLQTRALALYEALGLKKGMATALGNLGMIAEARVDLEKAKTFLTRALALNEELDRKEGMANDLGNLGIIAHTRGDLDEAEKLHTRSLALEEELARKEGIADTLGNLGIIAQMRGDLDEAEKLHTRSLALEEELARKEGIATSLGNLGTIAAIRGDLEKARALWIQARDLFSDIGMVHMAKKIQVWIDDLDNEDSD